MTTLVVSTAAAWGMVGLITTNWVRTAAWTARGLVLAIVLAT